MIYGPSTRVKRSFVLYVPSTRVKRSFVLVAPSTRVKKDLCHMTLALRFDRWMKKMIGYRSLSSCPGICSNLRRTSCLLGINNKFKNLQSKYKEDIIVLAWSQWDRIWVVRLCCQMFSFNMTTICRPTV